MKNFFLATILVFPTLLCSQILDPIEWDFSKKDLGGGVYELFFRASIEDGWHIYSQIIEDDGPLPTTFTFFESNNYELIGTTQEGEPIQEYDPFFDMILSYFSKQAVFSQKVKAISLDSKVDGELMFMVGDATQLLPPEYIDFSFILDSASEQFETKDEERTVGSPSFNLVSADNEESKNESSSEEEGKKLGPQGIIVFTDYEKGIAHAKKVGLPIMIDFTGHACVNCRKMEEQVWSNLEIKRILAEDVVLISLYVDERTPLPIHEQYETTIAGKKKKVRTVGDKWTVLQAEIYKTNSQPYYVVLDHDENQLGISANYQDYGEVDLFKTWLQESIEEFYQ